MTVEIVGSFAENFLLLLRFRQRLFNFVLDYSVVFFAYFAEIFLVYNVCTTEL